MKKAIALLLLLCLCMSACGSGGGAPAGTEVPAQPPAEQTEIRLGVLAGPTGMGAARLLQDAADGKTANRYDWTLFSAPDQVTAKLIAGELDIAAVPTNLAAVLYRKTEGSCWR